MSANYWVSSQKLHWQFTPPELEAARKKIAASDQERGIDSNQLSAYDGSMKLYIHGLVQVLGRHLNTRQRVLATAEVYLSRFFTGVSIHEVNLYVMVAACVYVACKTEECPQHIRTITSEARSIWPEYVTHDPTKIAECEFYLMEELDTYLIVHHPYRSLREITSILPETVALTGDEMQSAWSMINDSYATDLLLLFPPHVIAVACIYMTVVLRSPLARPARPPERIKARIDQLVVFLGDSGMNLDKMATCVQELISLYVRWETYEENACKQLLKRQLIGPGAHNGGGNGNNGSGHRDNQGSAHSGVVPQLPGGSGVLPTGSSMAAVGLPADNAKAFR